MDANSGALDGVHIGATWRIRLNHQCVAAMRPMSVYFGYLLFSSFVITSCYDVVSCVIQEQMLLTKDSLSQNMEAIKRKYEVQCICVVCFF